MRKLVVIVLACLAVPAVATARSVERGDGTFVVKNAAGTIVVNGAKGTILGRIVSGTVTVTDMNPFDENDPHVVGANQGIVPKSLTTTVYKGQDMKLRFVDGRYSVKIVGTGVGLSVVGSGRVRLLGLGTLDDGQFSLDGSPFKPLSTTQFVGAFGTSTSPIPAGG